VHNGCRESSTLYEPDKVESELLHLLCTFAKGLRRKADKEGAMSALEALFKKK